MLKNNAPLCVGFGFVYYLNHYRIFGGGSE